MLGTRIAASAPAPLRLNDRVITTTEFTQLVDEMHAHRGTRQATPADANVRQPDTRKLKLVPQDPVIQMHDHMQDVRYFNAPPESELPAGSELGRRLDLTNAGTQMFASSGCQVAAFDSRSGQRLWTSPSTGGSSLRPRPAVPLRACVTADRVFVRQWDTAGPTLTCLSRQTGARKWSRPSSAQEALISDPMLNNSSLYALTANHSDQQQVSVRLVRFDPFSGRSLSHRELVQLRKPWWDRRLCRVSWQTHSFIASLGGVVVCSDFSGQLQWLRSQTTVPVSVESSWQRRSFDPPLINNDRVYVTQPGIQVVDCLDRVGGELRWRAVVPSLRQLAGVSTSHAVIIVNDGLQALDCENGVIAWTHACTAPVNWARCSAGRYVVYCRQQSRPDPSGDSVPQLVWLDIMDGHEVHRASLDSLSAPQASLSPIFQMDNRVWALFSRGQRDPQPDLIELTPQVP